MNILIGAYTPDMQGHARGIARLQGDRVDEVLDVAGSPSWLTWHPARPVLYAALEGAGSVAAYTRAPDGTLTAIGRPVDVGRDVCHVAVAPDGSFLVAACYGDGRLVRVALDADGAPDAAVVGTEATDLYPAVPAAAVVPGDALPARAPAPAAPDRASHAHQARFTPAGLVSTDLGFDQVRMWRTAPGSLSETARVVLPRGTGPRHTLWHPSGHLFVVTEYSNEVFVLRPGRDGVWQLVAGVTLPGTQIGVDFPAEIASSRDGRFVYIGVRGSNTIATVQVRGEGSELRTVALVESGVDWPRHHLVRDDAVLVAGQRSDDVVLLPLDSRTGVPGRVRSRWDAPSPTCLVEDRP